MKSLSYHDINVLDNEQKTPFRYALDELAKRKRDNHEMLDYMLAIGADPTIQDKYGKHIKTTENDYSGYNDDSDDIKHIQTLLNYYKDKLAVFRASSGNARMTGGSNLFGGQDTDSDTESAESSSEGKLKHLMMMITGILT